MEYRLIQNNFKENVKDISKLMSFDKVVLDFAIENVRNLDKRLRKVGIENPRLLAGNTLAALENVKTNESLRPQYQVIYNQCIVLLVSVFASTIADVFRQGITDLAISGASKELQSEELKIPVAKLLEFDGEIKFYLGNLIADKNDLSFQDMKSIGRAFKTYFGITIEKDNDVNNIIMAQAGRHVIVHDSGRVSERLLRQVSNAKPRALKPNLTEDVIQFTSNEVELAAQSMTNYLNRLIQKVDIKIK